MLVCGQASITHLTKFTSLHEANKATSEMLLSLLSSKGPSNPAASLVLKAEDMTAAGSAEAFLKSHLRYVKDQHGQEICLLQLENGEEVGVMMGWERGISASLHVLATFTS